MAKTYHSSLLSDIERHPIMMVIIAFIVLAIVFILHSRTISSQRQSQTAQPFFGAPNWNTQTPIQVTYSGTIPVTNPTLPVSGSPTGSNPTGTGLTTIYPGTIIAGTQGTLKPW